jgi:hypothetical protein
MEYVLKYRAAIFIFVQIERNALVSVALRILEYHRGVLFLTTNRIKTFDEAFLSRFSIGSSLSFCTRESSMRTRFSYQVPRIGSGQSVHHLVQVLTTRWLRCPTEGRGISCWNRQASVRKGGPGGAVLEGIQRSHN